MSTGSPVSAIPVSLCPVPSLFHTLSLYSVPSPCPCPMSVSLLRCFFPALCPCPHTLSHLFVSLAMPCPISLPRLCPIPILPLISVPVAVFCSISMSLCSVPMPCPLFPPGHGCATMMYPDTSPCPGPS